MNYQESIYYLEQEIGFASCPGLERITNLMIQLGNPEKKLRVIHIAGTNGKGSAVAMLSAVLQAAGYRTGSYTSPHLERYNERFVINGEEISNEAFAALLTTVKSACLAMQTKGQEVPTLFEVVTAAAYLYFAQQQVDFAIMEVGLGGRFDATNIISQPILSLIMSISLDHTDYLGNTIAEIAKEKSGIIKKNCPVVLYSQDELVYNIVRKEAEKLHAPFYCTTDATVTISSQTQKGTVFSVKASHFAYEDLFLPLLGLHQVQNCIAVLEACAVLQKNGVALSAAQVRLGIGSAFWAGRMEICKEHPMVILDGAHNVDGIRRLAEGMELYFKDKDITLVLGVLGDKEYRQMAADILPLANRVILTEPHSERKLTAQKLAAVITNRALPVLIEPVLEDAYLRAVALAAEDGIILCCGSLYMIGALRTHILKHGMEV